MDPVSRRLASAAMGVAFALSRDEELEQTRLDLERARMTAEDFRQHVALELKQWQRQRQEAAGALARIIRTQPLPLEVFEEAQQFFDAYRYDSAEVREFAQDGRGDVYLDLDGDRDSAAETEVDF